MFWVGREKSGENIVKAHLNSEKILQMRFCCSSEINILEVSRSWLAKILP